MRGSEVRFGGNPKNILVLSFTGFDPTAVIRKQCPGRVVSPGGSCAPGGVKAPPWTSAVGCGALASDSMRLHSAIRMRLRVEWSAFWFGSGT